MAGYRVFIKTSAAKELEAVGSRKDRGRIAGKIRALGRQPRSHGCEKLRGGLELYRVRVGSYRVVYSIDDSAGEVHVVKVGHRRDAYR